MRTPHDRQPEHGIYHAKLTDPDTAMQRWSAGPRSRSAGRRQPRALLGALAARAGRGEIDRVKLYYFHAETPMAETVLRYELMGGSCRTRCFCSAPSVS